MKKRRRRRSPIDKLGLPPAQQQRLAELADHASSGQVTAGLLVGMTEPGQTRAAEALASELGRPLMRIDLSAVVSEYIGETEKNLGRVFDKAEAAGAVLFFDEADALFGQRTEVEDSNDRYAGLEVDYLLERIQQQPGLTVLATNMKDAQESVGIRFDYVIDLDDPQSS